MVRKKQLDLEYYNGNGTNHLLSFKNRNNKNKIQMKSLLLITILGLCISSCTSNWEYKVVTVKGTEKGVSKFDAKKFEISDESLNLFGKDGWELVAVYQTTETVHPNFGNDQYVSGLQPNVRTEEIKFVFKRKK